MHRIKGANSLFMNEDDRIMKYNRSELLKILSDNRFHSLEHSESDEGQPEGKRLVNVYNPSWRSEEVR